MATHAFIGVLNEKDQTVDYIYCHWDGSSQLSTLKKYYGTEEKARELINLGDISSLGSKVKPESGEHSYSNPQEEVTIAYHRDRGEDWNNVEFRQMGLSQYVPNSDETDCIHYLYLFEKNDWSVISDYDFES